MATWQFGAGYDPRFQPYSIEFVKWDDDEGLTGLPGSKAPKKSKSFNFGFYEAVVPQNLSSAQLKQLSQEAERKNPEGVRIVGLKMDNMTHVAGYLSFEDSASFVQWVEDGEHLPSILGAWKEQKKLAFGCPVRQGIRPSDKEFSAEKLFKFITNFTLVQSSLIQGSNFPITHKMLGAKDEKDDPGYISYLHTMHKIITTYPEHFPDDVALNLREMHSRENWFRALILLRVYWAIHRNGVKPRTKALPRKPAIKPLWLGELNFMTDLGENTDYVTYKDKEYSDLYKLEANDIDEEFDPDPVGTQNDNIAEAEKLHRSLNQSGNVSKEASVRAKQRGKMERPWHNPEQLKVFCNNLEVYLKEWIVDESEVQGPRKESMEENRFIKDTMEFAQVCETLEELSEEDREDFENGRNQFFAALEQMSTASATPPSFIKACKTYNIKLDNPKKIQIPGTNLTPYPHQVIDMAWLAGMEDTFFGGGILASECGSGKTLVMLLLILMVHRKLKAENSVNHYATLIVVPSAVIDVWWQDYSKFFSNALTCRIFYGRASKLDGERERCYIGSNIKDLELELQALDPKNPATSKTFFLTSYTTFARRAMKIKESNLKPKGDDDADTINYISDEEEIDSMENFEEQDERVLKKYKLNFNHHGRLGRVIADEAHLIKNPCTLAADAIYKLKVPRTILATATPMINRINDLRGLLIQLLKVKELPLTLPETLAGLVSIYHDDFDPLTDFPAEGGRTTPKKSILPQKSDDPDVRRFFEALECQVPLHKLCPRSFLIIGNMSNWTPSVARDVLRPILLLIQRRRLMSHTFDTINGETETPGKEIPHYTVKTVRFKMTKRQARQYMNETIDWQKKLYVPGEAGAPITSVKRPNSSTDVAINMEAFRGLQLSSFDTQLIPLIRRKVKDVPVGTSQEVRSWYERDDDHGLTMKYYRTRPIDAYYIPPPANRFQMASVSMGGSIKMKALVHQISEWKSKGERCLVFFNWPMSQWAAEGVLNLLGFKVMSVLASHKHEDRRNTIRQFNDPNHQVDVMLIGFRIGSYGLNFHGACSKMIICEYPSSIDILLQVFGRIHRLGQKKQQEIIIFFTEGTFDESVWSSMSKKFLSKLVAEGEFGGIEEEKLMEEGQKIIRKLLGED